MSETIVAADPTIPSRIAETLVGETHHAALHRGEAGVGHAEERTHYCSVHARRTSQA